MVVVTQNQRAEKEPEADPPGGGSRYIKHLTRAAVQGTLATLALRLFSFICTQWTMRVLDPATLGRASIQLELLQTTVLFLSREGFRLALTRNVSSDNWAVAWLCIPTGTLISLLALLFHLQYFAAFVGNAESNDSDDPDYRFAGILYCLACWIEILGEPAALLSLRELNVTRKVSAESIATVSKTVATVILLQYLRLDWPVTAFGLAHMVYATVYTSFLYFGTWKHIPGPTFNALDPRACHLTIVFTLQGCFKHFLTEADRIILTAMSEEYNQGVYAMGSSYGGMAARILFQPIEENCRLLWSRLAQQGGGVVAGDGEKSAAKLEDSYTLVIKFVLYIGFVFCFLAVNYTEILLNILAGKKWGNNAEAVAVLSSFCVYTAFMSWNGTTEAFVYACVNSGGDIGRLSLAHTIVGVVFALTGPIAVRRFGTVGLVAVNCFAMFLRSIYSLYSAAQFFSKLNSQSVWHCLLHLLRRMLPHPVVTAAFVLSYIVTGYSLQELRETCVNRGIPIGSTKWLKYSLRHIGVGASCAIVVFPIAFSLEKEFRRGLSQMRKKQHED